MGEERKSKGEGPSGMEREQGAFVQAQARTQTDTDTSQAGQPNVR